MNRFSKQGGIFDPAGHAIGIGIDIVSLRGSLPFLVQVDAEQVLAQDEHENRAQDAQRIGYRICGSDGAGRPPSLFEDLLCGTQAGGIGNGTRHDTRHDSQVFTRYQMDDKSGNDSQRHQRNGHQVHGNAVFAE